MKTQLETLAKQMDGLLEFRSKVTPKHFVEDGDGQVVEVEDVIPNEAIMTAFKDEQERKKKFKHLSKTLGDEELARELLKLKTKKKKEDK